MKRFFSKVCASALVIPFCTQIVNAQTPTVRQIENAQLLGGFTLEYKVTERDVRTSGMRENDSKGVRASYQASVRRDAMSQQQADQVLKNLAQKEQSEAQTRHYFVTISATPESDKLLFKRKDDHGTQVVIYDGDSTYRYVSFAERLYITPGLSFHQMAEFPFPGLGLPYVPLMQSPSVSGAEPNKVSGRTPMLRSKSGKKPIVYAPAEFEVAIENQKVKVLGATATAKGVRFQNWSFGGHRLFQGRWLATQMQWSRYSFGGDAEKVSSLPPAAIAKQMLPAIVCDYRLQQSSTTSLSEDQFDYKTYLKPQKTIIEQDNGRDVVSFLYEPTKGDLAKQRSNQAYMEQAYAQYVQRNSDKGSGNSRLILLPAFVAIIGLFMWKRRHYSHL